ncbi:MAG: CoA transferase [Candidatus Tectomicrobia bacterium]|uniref:CoA transferase n=1 Tax=Tectimicrobiota bacterium TaxID=2528274 RepID=A0A932CMK1_UNCTE|nr:CoA transferase [Candidatus Tectomicrobia bacterium]
MKKEEFFKEAIPGSAGPLEGLRVLEATTSLAGPFVGTLLADMGAEVIKCEMPGTGEIIRYCPPFLPTPHLLDRSLIHLSVNRNKKNITLALNRKAGAQIFRELAAKADVVVQNYKPGTMEKWGAGYEELRRVKADLIYTSISGYGQFGPYHTKPGYDPVAQAMSGLMNITGEPEGPPTTTGNYIADNITGWQGAFATLAALYYREKTGKGQHVDVSLLDTLIYTSEMGIMGAAQIDFAWRRMGSGAHPVGTRVLYRCTDGYVCLLVGLQAHWERLCHIMGREDLIDDPRTRTIVDRATQPDFAAACVQEWTQTQTVSEVVRLLDEAELVVAPIYGFPEVLQDGHIREREMVTEVEHPLHGRLKLYGVAAKHSLTPGRVRTAAPMLGQHNQEIYGKLLGYGEEKLSELREAGII